MILSAALSRAPRGAVGAPRCRPPRSHTTRATALSSHGCSPWPRHGVAILLFRPERGIKSHGISPKTVVGHYIFDVIARGQYGFRWLQHAGNPIAVLLVLLSVTAVLAGALFVARRRPPSTLEIVALVVSGLLLYVGPVMISGSAAIRYSVTPIVLLLAALLATLDAALTATTHDTTTRVHGAVLIVTIAVVALNLRIEYLAGGRPFVVSGAQRCVGDL